jgi:hypothetical protein
VIEIEQQKKVIIQRIISHLNQVPADAIQELLRQGLPNLTRMLDKLATTRDQGQVEDATLARAQEAIRASKLDHAWAYALLKVSLNGKYLQETEANKNILEGMLQPHEEPSPALYSTLLTQFSNQFSWMTTQPKPIQEDQRKAFDAFVREHSLSSVDANFKLFQQGASAENFAGASGIERARYAAEAATARQHFLIHSATPQQLKEEARFQSAIEREIAVKAEADRQHQFVSQQQQGLYSTLPSHNQAGELMDSKYFRRLSTVDYPAFKLLVRKYGSAQITEVLRAPATIN